MKLVIAANEKAESHTISHPPSLPKGIVLETFTNTHQYNAGL